MMNIDIFFRMIVQQLVLPMLIVLGVLILIDVCCVIGQKQLSNKYYQKMIDEIENER